MAIQTVSWNIEVPIKVAPSASGSTWSLINGAEDLTRQLFTIAGRANTYGISQGEGAGVLTSSTKAVRFNGLNRKAVIRGVAPSIVSTQTAPGLSVGPGQIEWLLFASSEDISVSNYALTNNTSRQQPGYQLRTQASQISQGWASNGNYHPAEIEIPRSTEYLYALARGWYGKVRSVASNVNTSANDTELEVYSACLTLQIDV